MGAGADTIKTFIDPYVDPAQVAQRREFQKARDRLRTESGYGMSRAQKQQERAEGNRPVEGQVAAQQAALQQQMATGSLSSGAANLARQAIFAQQGAAAAQSERNIQARSSQIAQQQRLADQARIDAEAARAVARSQQLGEGIKKTTNVVQQFTGGFTSGKNGQAVNKVADVPPSTVGGSVPAAKGP